MLKAKLDITALYETIESDLLDQLYTPLLSEVKRRTRAEKRYFSFDTTSLVVSAFFGTITTIRADKKGCSTWTFASINSMCFTSLEILRCFTESDNSIFIEKSKVELFAAHALLESITKKFVEGDEGRLSCDKAAVELFCEMNNRNKGRKVYSEDTYVTNTINLAKMHLASWFGRASISDSGVPMPGFGDGDLWTTKEHIGDRGRFGPGSSVGTRSTAFVEKVGGATLTATSLALYHEYYKTTLSSQTCNLAELYRLKDHGFRIVDSSALTCVPKSRKISRTICTEPSLNMFFQLGLGTMMSERLRECTGINLSFQPGANKQLAKLGSVSGRYATIDLRSASDTISLRVCRKMLPSGIFQLMMELRSKETRLPNGKKERIAMMSSMGNGFTFPLQTALFAAVVRGAYTTCGIKIKNPRLHGVSNDFIGNWGVFGDDIVVDTRVFSHVCKVLDAMGFIVNTDKSFSSGSFRESCGGDYFNGYHVRGVYIQSLDGPRDLYTAINRLVQWSSVHTLLPKTVKLLWKHCDKRFIVPLSEDMSSGLQVPFHIARKSCFVSRSKDGLLMYRRLAQLPNIKKTDELEKSNPLAVLKGILRGDVVDKRYTVRSTGPIRVTSRKAVVPNWDYLPADVQIMYEGNCEAWKRAWDFYFFVAEVPRSTT